MHTLVCIVQELRKDLRPYIYIYICINKYTHKHAKKRDAAICANESPQVSGSLALRAEYDTLAAEKASLVTVGWLDSLMWFFSRQMAERVIVERQQ